MSVHYGPTLPCPVVGLNVLLPPEMKGPCETCNQGSIWQRQLVLGLPLILSLTCQWAKGSPALAHFFSIKFPGTQSRALHMLSPVASSTLSASFVSLFSALMNLLSKSPGRCHEIISIRRQEPTHYSLAWGISAPFPGQLPKTTIAYS